MDSPPTTQPTDATEISVTVKVPNKALFRLLTTIAAVVIGLIL